jgi:hypothetical protein
MVITIFGERETSVVVEYGNKQAGIQTANAPLRRP